jgi:hypothetical protein
MYRYGDLDICECSVTKRKHCEKCHGFACHDEPAIVKVVMVWEIPDTGTRNFKPLTVSETCSFSLIDHNQKLGFNAQGELI